MGVKLGGFAEGRPIPVQAIGGGPEHERAVDRNSSRSCSALAAQRPSSTEPALRGRGGMPG
ncbi:MAG TPA: hypothetical protein VFK05_17180, partial [Polyangiaceae bacterium]|nr:hypothetical protein [Polyangiaceae bacterium]